MCCEQDNGGMIRTSTRFASTRFSTHRSMKRRHQGRRCEKVEHVVLLESVFCFCFAPKQGLLIKARRMPARNQESSQKTIGLLIAPPIRRAAVCHARTCVATAGVRTGVNPRANHFRIIQVDASTQGIGLKPFGGTRHHGVEQGVRRSLGTTRI